MATLAEIRERVQNDLDLKDEDFIKAEEINAYIRSGVSAAEKIVLTLNEDYFLTNSPVTFVNGQQAYALPTDIYAQKIRHLIYDNGSKEYVITRVKKLAHTVTIRDGDDYKYLITNSLLDGYKVVFYPTPKEDGPQATIWYLRNAKALALDADVLDIPEAYEFVVQFAKDKCANKEKLTPDAGPSPALLQEEKVLTESLMNRTPDDDNFIEPDMGFYCEVN